jgi:hypothetical protein
MSNQSSDFGLEEQVILKINREMRYQLDEIILRIRELAKKFNIASTGEKSPFRNVMTVAVDQSSSLEVIKTYIRYQVGRKDASKIWKKDPKFSEAVVEQIDQLSIRF